jgi:6-pyruvoyltetrahydropterin/6-carboxytetrahydropterin synthase
MYTITKQFTFSASHQLAGLPDGHPCGRVHGHNYIVEVVLQSERLNEVGFVRDYGELWKVKSYIDEGLDHRHLNDVLPVGCNPTAENLAHRLFDYCILHWPEVVAVRVSETAKTWAEYRPRRFV